MKNQYRRAFSLIELSVVILIIGVLIAGVTQSSRLILQFKLQSARNLTNSSPVASIKGVLLWLETTDTASIEDAETENNSPVSLWKDLNPQSSFKNNATSSGEDPIYIAECINGLPCLRFGGDKSLAFDGSGLVGIDYTVIYVEQRRAANVNGKIIGSGGVAAANEVLDIIIVRLLA